MFIIIFILLFNLYDKNNIENLEDTGPYPEIIKALYLTDIKSICNFSY
jgi:hypothetical protein